jgi:hypothetical protein
VVNGNINGKMAKGQSGICQNVWHFISSLVDFYVDFVMSWTARVILAFALIIYWSISAYGGILVELT